MDVVDRWYAQTADAVAAQGGAPDPVRTRTWAMAWWAADRAIGSGSSVAGVDDAALAAAVHDVLAVLVPDRRAALDAALGETVEFVIDSVAPQRVAATATADARLVWIGEDDRGIELEIVALDLDDAVVVIHVMLTAMRRL